MEIKILQWKYFNNLSVIIKSIKLCLWNTNGSITVIVLKIVTLIDDLGLGIKENILPQGAKLWDIKAPSQTIQTL